MAEQKPGFSSFLKAHHYHDGILYPNFVPKEQLEKLKTFPVRDDDIFLASYPKSGTHWVLKIVVLILRNGDDQVMERTPERSKDYEWLEATLLPDSHGVIGDAIHSLPGPRVLQSHQRYSKVAGGPPNTTKARYITCARNPKDIVVSFFNHFTKRHGLEINFDLSWDEFVQHFLRGDVSFGSWWDHVPEWWAHRDEPNVLFLKYEDLLKDLPSNVKKIADFLGCSLDQDTIQKIAQATTLESMKVNSVEWKEGHFIHKGIVGDWKNHFTPAQSQAIDVLYVKAVEGTGLELEFD